MKIKEYLAKHPEINPEEFWKKVRLQYNATEDSTLTYYMVWMDKPFWWIEHIYDIAYWRKDAVGDFGICGTTFEFIVEKAYDEKEAAWLTSEEAEDWFKKHHETL